MSVSDKFLKKKLSVYISASIAGLVSSAYVGAQSEIEEVIVRSSFIDRTVDQIINPLHIVNGDDLATGATQSLGASLDGLLGVASADYGAAVGQPIIRGLSGGRVKVLNNGMIVRDVSGVGVDHNVEVDLNNIDQIEVVRGPSSLLYANGGVGGIINIVDSTIAREDFSESDLRLGLESQSVNDGETFDFSYQNNLGGLNFSLGYKKSEFGNFDIPDGAVLHDEEEHEEDHEEGHEEEGHEENLGYLMNSDSETETKRFGVSKVGDWGYFGVSVNNNESLFGIPFHGDDHDEHGDMTTMTMTMTMTTMMTMKKRVTTSMRAREFSQKLTRT
jgi:iron complex outermembrane receptor protein